jgi:hypothetical protein
MHSMTRIRAALQPVADDAAYGRRCPIAAVHIRSEDCWGESEAVIRSGRPPKASLARYGRYRLYFAKLVPAARPQ